MDLTESIAPKSDQINAEDLLTGPRTFTIAEVKSGSSEQPVNVHLVEFPGRPYRPSKSMRRIMVAAWGKDSAAYAGRRLTLFRDPKVRFGSDEVGGIKISHVSHIDEPTLKLALTVTRGKRATYVVERLDDAATPTVAPAGTLAELTAMFVRKGIPEAARLDGANRITGGSATSLEHLTATDVLQVLAMLEHRPDVTPDPVLVDDVPVCPECQQGKHGNCAKQAMDADGDLVSCTCPDCVDVEVSS